MTYNKTFIKLQIKGFHNFCLQNQSEFAGVVAVNLLHLANHMQIYDNWFWVVKIEKSCRIAVCLFAIGDFSSSLLVLCVCVCFSLLICQGNSMPITFSQSMSSRPIDWLIDWLFSFISHQFQSFELIHLNIFFFFPCTQLSEWTTQKI